MTKRKKRAKKLHNHGLSKCRVYGIFLRMGNLAKEGKIQICREWVGRGRGLSNFVACMGHPPEGQALLLKEGCAVYGPGNCKWGPSRSKGRPMPIAFIHDGIDKAAGGVYMLSFSNGTFYIGSTRNFRNRIGAYKTEIRDGYTQSKGVRLAIDNSEWVVFKVLEHISEINQLKIREDMYIKQHAADNRFLNRSKNAFSNKGCRWTPEERMKMSLANKGNPRIGRPRIRPRIPYVKKGPKYIPVAAFDLNGEPLGIFISMKQAADHFGVPREKVCRVANKKQKHFKGYIFKRIE